MPRAKSAAHRKAKPGDPTLVVGYIRVSTDEQKLGPEAQEQAIQAWCEKQGKTLVSLHYDHLSGSSLPEDRPGFMDAVEAVRSKNAGILLILRRDRLARSVHAAAVAEHLVERCGGQIVGTDEDPLTSNEPTPFDLLMRQFKDIMAAYERAMVRDRTKRALGVKRIRNERVGSIPYGFMADPAGGKVMVPCPAEQANIETIRGIHQVYKLSLRALINTLNAQGIHGRSGRWHPETIRRILHGPRT